MDVDGVLTDGRLYYTSSGETIKVFNVHDGLGIKLIQSLGIKIGVISGRESTALQNRLTELGITETYTGRRDKDRVLDHILKTHQLHEDQLAFIGDDLVDIPVLKRVGFSITTPDAPEEVKKLCVYITVAKGGQGAVREIAELFSKLLRS